MSAAGGSEVKIRIGDFEARQKLGAPNQYQVYRFAVNLDRRKGRVRWPSCQPTACRTWSRFAPSGYSRGPKVSLSPSGRQSIGKTR